MEFNPLVPERTVFDIEASKSFYAELGFVVEYERPEDGFAFVSKDGCQLMLERASEDGWNSAKLEWPLGCGVNFELEVADVQEVYERAKACGASLFRDMMTNTYRVGDAEVDQREFIVQDPNGYLLRFTG